MSDTHDAVTLGLAFASSLRIAAIYVDASGVIRSWNLGAEQVFGCTASQAIGRRADLVVPKHYRDAHWIGFNRAMQSPWRGSESWSPVDAVHLDGHLVELEVFLLPVDAGTEHLDGVLAIFRPRIAESRDIAYSTTSS
jgi:PAS domain S-box-containing protein